MRKIIFPVFLLIMIGNLFAEINVKSFRVLENDIDARVNAPIMDFNGDLSAIIKVVTTQTGFTFDCGQAGVVKTINKPAEIWVYVPFGTKHLTITHARLGILRDYIFPLPIEKASVYELVLATAKVVTTVEEDQLATEWVVITSVPSGADVYIDDKSTGKQTPFTGQFPMGSHTYSINIDLYHSDGGKFDLIPESGKKKIVSILKPAFGQLKLSSLPESGASITLDGKPIIQTTPCKIEKIISGKHSISVSKALYHESTQDIFITDGQLTTTLVNIKPDYGSIVLNSLPESEAVVTLDDVSTGKTTPCTIDKVLSGSHTVFLRREWYAPVKKQVSIVDGEKTSLDVSMNALFGNITITSFPEADLFIDNIKISTGTYTGRLNEGIYSIEARKVKYNTDIQKVKITVGEQKTINLTPKAQTGTLEIESTPIDATISLDGVNKGTTPATIRNLLVGTYTLVLSMPNYAPISKTITITEGQTVKVNEPLSNGREVTIKSSIVGARLLIDNTYVGITPYKSILTFGKHNLSIEKTG